MMDRASNDKTGGTSDAPVLSSSTDVTLAVEANKLSCFASLISSAIRIAESGNIEQPMHEYSTQLASLYPDRVQADQECCQIPSLELRQRSEASQSDTKPPSFADASTEANSESSSLVESASRSMSRHRILARKDLPELPIQLLWSFSKSFLYLIDTRLRSSLSALLRSRATSSISPILAELLGGDVSPIAPSLLLTQFQALDSHINLVKPAATDQDGMHTKDVGGEYEAVMPIVVDICADFVIFGKVTSVRLDTPGVLQGLFVNATAADTSNGHGSIDAIYSNSTDNGSTLSDRVELLYVDLTLDTHALLNAMMAKARALVRRAVGEATHIASTRIRQGLTSMGMQPLILYPPQQDDMTAGLPRIDVVSDTAARSDEALSDDAVGMSTSAESTYQSLEEIVNGNETITSKDRDNASSADDLTPATIHIDGLDTYNNNSSKNIVIEHMIRRRAVKSPQVARYSERTGKDTQYYQSPLAQSNSSQDSSDDAGENSLMPPPPMRTSSSSSLLMKQSPSIGSPARHNTTWQIPARPYREQFAELFSTPLTYRPEESSNDSRGRPDDMPEVASPPQKRHKTEEHGEEDASDATVENNGDVDAPST